MLGFLDELVLLPLGVLAVRAMVPPAVMADCRIKTTELERRPTNWIAAGVIVAIWATITVAFVMWLV
jgi:hypothetical protein